MTEYEICLRMLHYFRNRTDILLIPNIFVGHFEIDLLQLSKAGMTTEYEIKISKADFKKDAEKSFTDRNFIKTKKHDYLRSGQGSNYFYFILPKGIIDISEVPDFAGLIELGEDVKEVRYTKHAPLLTKNKNEGIKETIFKSGYYRYLQHKLNPDRRKYVEALNA